MKHNLILWVIDEQHRAEQRVSEESVARHMPDVERRCIIVPDGRPWYEKYIVALQASLDTPFKRFLFLDSDTYLCESVRDIFELLEKYDIASTHAPARQTTDMPPLPKIPDAYPEFNTGVFGYANNENVKELFKRWLMLYHINYNVTGDNDQAPLRMAMWEQSTKAWVLPPEYNFRFGFGAFAAGRVKILHGRSSDVLQLERTVNAVTEMRTFERSSLQ